MRGGGAPSCGGMPDLGDDQRPAGGGRLVGHGAKPVGRCDRLEIEQKDVGAAVIEHPIDVVMRLEDRLVAGADLIGETQLPVAPAVEKGEGQGAALAADRDRPAMRASSGNRRRWGS